MGEKTVGGKAGYWCEGRRRWMVKPINGAKERRRWRVKPINGAKERRRWRVKPIIVRGKEDGGDKAELRSAGK